MDVKNKVAIVTGGANGMGASLCRALAAAGASVIVADVDAEGGERVAESIGAVSITTDVRVEAQMVALVDAAKERFGRVDVFVSNAGVLWGAPARPGVDLQDRGNPWASNEAWQQVWDVNVMPLVYAARAVLPMMIERGGGYIVQNASAGALLTTLGNAPYATSKHAVLGLAEWLSIHYGDAGIKVSCIVAEGVRTAMLQGAQGEWFAVAGAIESDEAARLILDGMREETFLIKTHPNVDRYFQGKAGDYDGWLAKMRHLHAKTPR